MDFAKGLLSKYGWEEGKGLGKHETGITKAIKPKLKFDNAGIGHDGAESFTHYWWEHTFNDAANNITVCQMEDGISLKTAHELDISTRKVSPKKRKNLIFNNFLRSATTLTNEGLIVASTESTVADDHHCPPMTDEDLFAACGGRTAHKGARHGLGLNGKLARVEEQERRALALMSTDPKVEDVCFEEDKKRKKKKKKSKKTDSPQGETDAVEDSGRKHEKRKSKAGSEDVELVNRTLDRAGGKRKSSSERMAAASSDSESGVASGADESNAEKRKKRKDTENLQVDNTVSINTNRKRKKSEKSAVASSGSEIPASLESSEVESNAGKRKKKKSRAGTQDLEENNISENASKIPKERMPTEVEGNISKISTKKRKKMKRKLEAELEQTEPSTLKGNDENSINVDIDVGSIVKKAKKSKI